MVINQMEVVKLEKHLVKKLGTAVLLGDFEPNSVDWHGARSEGIGGSEVGTILGLNPWESAYTLFHKKLGNISDELEQNWMIRFGKAFEEPILNLFAEEHPELDIYLTGTYQHKDMPWMHANPDAIAKHKTTGEWFIIEIKYARAGWTNVPPHYWAQVTHYLDVFGWKRGYLVGVAGSNWEEHLLESDDFEREVQRDAIKRFWGCVVAERAPDWDGSKSTYETVRKLHPEIDNNSVTVSSELVQTIKEKAKLVDEATAELNKAKSQLLDSMGQAKYAHVLENGQEVIVAQRQARGVGTPYLVMK